MKSGNYDELLDKFYAGTASAEEIAALQSAALLSEQDMAYAETLNEERGQKMNWEFEDFMKDIPEQKATIIPVRNLWIRRTLSAAAVIAAIVTTYIFWPQPQNDTIAIVPVSNKKVAGTKEQTTVIDLPAGTDAYTVQQLEKPVEQTAHKGARTSTIHKKHPVKKNTQIPDKKSDLNMNKPEDFLVMVNGKPITNEADAVAITRESLGLVARNLSLTPGEKKHAGRIRIEL